VRRIQLRQQGYVLAWVRNNGRLQAATGRRGRPKRRVCFGGWGAEGIFEQLSGTNRFALCSSPAFCPAPGAGFIGPPFCRGQATEVPISGLAAGVYTFSVKADADPVQTQLVLVE